MLQIFILLLALSGKGRGVKEDYRQLLEKLQLRLGYQFSRLDLLRSAMVHKSFANERLGNPALSNERQEFLGDAVVDLVVADLLYKRHPHLPEGDLSRMRAELVSSAALAALARQLRLGPCLRLGCGEQRSGGQDKDSLLADALEALLGAVYLDGGFASAYQVIEQLFAAGVVAAAGQYSDHKTRLQELSQARFGEPPQYRQLDVSGPDHQRRYTVVVSCGPISANGSGGSKKAAQQQAAALALALLEQDNSINDKRKNND